MTQNERVQALVRHWDWLADLPRQRRAELEAGCVILGHEPCGEVYLTTIPTHVCLWCLARFTLERR